MLLPQWLRQLQRRWSAVSVRRRDGRVLAPRHGARPRLEALEERLTPSTDVLVFSTLAQTLTVGQPSAALTVQLQDGNGNAVQAASGGVAVNLSSSSPTSEFLDTSGNPLPTNPAGLKPSILIPAGSSSVSFEYEDTHAGTPTLTASATGDTSATQQEKVNLPMTNVIHVTNTQDSSTEPPPSGSLRAAILAANASAGSTIVFDSGVTGTIDLVSDLPALTANTNIYGPGASVLTLVGAGTSQAQGEELTVSSGAQVTMTDLTFTYSGATALDNQGNLTLRRVTVSQSNAAVLSSGTALTVDDSTITKNLGKVNGEAAGITATNGTTAVLNSTINGNGDTGIDNAGGTMTLNNVLVSDNDALGASLPSYGDPGGIGNTAALTIENSTVADNTSIDGDVAGGLESESGSVTVVNSTFAGNVASNFFDAGGIGIDGGTASIANSTISGNTAGQEFENVEGSWAGGIDAFGSMPVTIYDTIVAGNTGPPNNPTDVAGQFASSGYNLIGAANTTPGTGTSSGFVSTDQVGTTTSPIIADLGSLQNNGGPTPTLALQAGSPALAAGSSTNAPATDQRGVARPTTGSIDIGAFESTPPISFSPITLPAAIVNSAYNQTITAGGGSGTLTVGYTLASGNSIPAGLTFTPSGNTLTLSGTPTASGSVMFTLTATDSSHNTASQSYTLTVNAASTTLSLSPTTLPAATVNTSYNQVITAGGGSGTPTVSYTLASGNSIPAGLTFTPSGNTLTLSGTPTVSGSVSFTVTATDSTGATISQTYSLTVNAVSTSQVTQAQQDVTSLAVDLLTGHATSFFSSLSDFNSLPASAQQQALQSFTSELFQFVFNGLAQANPDSFKNLVLLDLLLTYHII